MKIVLWSLLVLITLVRAPVSEAADTPSEAVVTLEPFEPSYKEGDKFARPREVVAPRFLWPYEMRRATGSGEVVILVELDGHGRARRLATLYSTHPLFAKSAIEGLKRARWESSRSEWFYYKVVFDVTADEPNQPPKPR